MDRRPAVNRDYCVGLSPNDLLGLLLADEFGSMGRDLSDMRMFGDSMPTERSV